MLGWLNGLRVATRVVVLTSAILVVVLVVNYGVFAWGYRDSAGGALVDKARAFTAIADAAMTAETEQGITVGEDGFSHTGWAIAKQAAQRERLDFRLTAFQALNPANEPEPGSFDEQTLRQLIEQAGRGGDDTLYVEDSTAGQLHFLRAIRLGEGCLGCHASETGASKAGDIHGTYHMVMPLDVVDSQVTSFVLRGVGWSLPLAIASLACLIVVLRRTVAAPIRDLSDCTGAVERGDLTRDLPATLRERRDEVGELSKALQRMTERLRGVIGDIDAGVETLVSSGTSLNAVSEHTATGTRAMAERATTVAAAAEESSANTAAVAASMERAAHSLTSVAGATEQMSSTIGEVAQNAARARGISDRASSQAAAVSAVMRELGQAAREIGQVTETINEISSQTNLLALNATIEAARAGAAGKGFAVVAEEIKELARQTARATDDIKAKIAAVQGSTGGAISDIEKITEVVHEVGGLVNAIAAAIEEQATVTRDVAGNVAQASSGVQEAHDRIAETATVSRAIAQDIASLNASVAEVRDGGAQVRASASGLTELATRLRGVVGQFKTRVA